MHECKAPISDEALLDYWLDESAADDVGPLEAHLFECPACTSRLEQLEALRGAVAALARAGRVKGLVSRGLLNRLQRDGARVRWYTVSPGETVPCAMFPGDDVIVTSLRADFSTVDRVSLAVVGPHGPLDAPEETAVSRTDTELIWAIPAGQVRALPSQRLELTLAALEPVRRILGEYVLEHTAVE
jgi:anti-sigma factor RsiW